jgi:hypothetical protein
MGLCLQPRWTLDMNASRPAVLLSTTTILFMAQGSWASPVPFGPRQDQCCSFQAVSLSTPDLDGDGDRDLLYVDRATGSFPDAITWSEKLDQATWVWHRLEAFDGAASVVAADIDRDGDLDLLGASTEGLIAWWANEAGNGTSWTRHTVASGFGGALAVTAADVDGDGDQDVVAASNVGDEVAWWRNTAGNGSAWSSKQTIDAGFDAPFGLAVADMDRDGDLDVLAGTNNIGGVHWWENSHPTGNGSAWIEHTVIGVGGGLDLEAADMDRDGDVDILVAGIGSTGIGWSENRLESGLAWVRHGVESPFNARSVAAADLDADGDLDVLGAGDNKVIWWENTAPDGTAWAEHALDDLPSVNMVHAADLDMDADFEVVAGNGFMYRFENTTVHRGAVFSARRPLDDVPVFAIIVPADLDRDGDMDVLAGDSNADAISWWENITGDATAWTRRTVAPSFAGVRAADAADVDGDGDLDVFGAAVGGDIAWWENTAGDASAWTRHDVGSVDGGFALAAADIDRDGDQDVVTTGFNDGEIAWWSNNTGAGTTWTKRPIATLDRAWDLRAADIDRDGDPDVLVVGRTANEIVWYEQRPASVWTRHLVAQGLSSPESVFAADMDRDGDLDVLGISFSPGGVAWWQNNGTSSAWTQHGLGSLPFGAAVAAADLDADGDQDVIAAGVAPGQVLRWENDGTLCGATCTWPQRTMDADFESARSLAVADVDRDGDLDVLGSVYHAVWWPNDRDSIFADGFE